MLGLARNLTFVGRSLSRLAGQHVRDMDIAGRSRQSRPFREKICPFCSKFDCHFERHGGRDPISDLHILSNVPFCWNESAMNNRISEATRVICTFQKNDALETISLNFYSSFLNMKQSNQSYKNNGSQMACLLEYPERKIPQPLLSFLLSCD